MNDDDVYRSYALSIYERVKGIHQQTSSSAVQEALVANTQAGCIQYITVPLHEPKMDFDFRDDQVRDWEPLQVEDMSILIPIL